VDRKGFIKAVGLGFASLAVLGKKALGSAPSSQARFWSQEEIELFGRKATLFHWPNNRFVILYRDSPISVWGRGRKWNKISGGEFALVPPFRTDTGTILQFPTDCASKYLGMFKIEGHPKLAALVASNKPLRPAGEEVGRDLFKPHEEDLFQNFKGE